MENERIILEGEELCEIKEALDHLIGEGWVLHQKISKDDDYCETVGRDIALSAEDILVLIFGRRPRILK